MGKILWLPSGQNARKWIFFWKGRLFVRGHRICYWTEAFVKLQHLSWVFRLVKCFFQLCYVKLGSVINLHCFLIGKYLSCSLYYIDYYYNRMHSCDCMLCICFRGFFSVCGTKKFLLIEEYLYVSLVMKNSKFLVCLVNISFVLPPHNFTPFLLLNCHICLFFAACIFAAFKMYLLWVLSLFSFKFKIILSLFYMKLQINTLHDYFR